MIINCKKISILALIALVVVACQKDDAIPEYNNFSDALATSGDKRIQRSDFASFADLSKGVVDRLWTIPESASITNLDGRDPSQVELIQVQFDEPGQFEVNLKDEFINSAVVLDTTFNITVLDYIQTNFDVVSIDASFHEETPTQITMYEGSTITFQDVSQGSPNRRKWTFPGGDPSSAGGISIEEDDDVSSISVTYPTIGTYDVELISWRQYPEGIADTLRLQNYINVTENLEPPTIMSIIEDAEGVIDLKYNLPLQSSNDLTNHFEVLVDGSSVGIQNVSLDPNDNKIVKIIPLVNPNILSTASISYSGNGDLARTNDVPVAAFSNEVVTLHSIANPEIYGFEDGGIGWENPTAWDWDNEGAITYPSDNPATGQYSMKMETTANARCRAFSNAPASLFDLDSEKSYTIEFKVWIDTNYTDTNIFPEVFKSGQWAGEGFWTSVANLPRGEWITINKEAVKIWSPDVSGQYFFSFRFQKTGVVYIDDVKIYEVE
jgi:PBP1b-binding outer membrane lipoprotein LpoB